jgi:hypothetical protein
VYCTKRLTTLFLAVTSNPPAPQGPPGPQVGFAPPTPVGSFPSQPPPPPGGVPLPPMAPRLPTML